MLPTARWDDPEPEHGEEDHEGREEADHDARLELGALKLLLCRRALALEWYDGRSLFRRGYVAGARCVEAVGARFLFCLHFRSPFGVFAGQVNRGFFRGYFSFS